MKRYTLMNGELQDITHDMYTKFQGNKEIVLASDYDAVAAELAALKDEKPWDDLGAKQVEVLGKRIAALEAALRDITGIDPYPECYRLIQKIARAALGLKEESE